MQLEEPAPAGLYFMNNSFLYTDVQLEIAVMDTADAPHTVSLVCRGSAAGWYEFEISNLGSYTIYAYDYQNYTGLSSGEVPVEAIGGVEQTYTAICQGNQLTLSVNNIHVVTIEDAQYSFAEGQVGLGVFSAEGSPVELDLESVTISEPVFEEREVLISDVTAATEEAAATLPEETPAPEVSDFYTEEFDVNYVPDRWNTFTLGTGRDSNLLIQPEEDHLLFDLGDEDLYVYHVYTAYEYGDVTLKLNAENLGRNNNNVSLVCRMNADQTQWYEFSVESGGLWYLYAVRDGTYHIIGEGGAQALRQGQEVNEYAMTCQANQITLFVNDDQLTTVTDNTFRFESGLVGFNISSLNVLPITVAVNWFEISPP
jgi:hypothetical protein